MKLSVVSTLYNSEKYIESFIHEVIQVLNDLKDEVTWYEIILVDDGSADNSLSKAIQLKSNYPHIKIVSLSRNFGHHNAAFCGLSLATGDLIFYIDSDLEVSPSILKILYYKLKENKDVDVVYCYQSQRQGNWIDEFLGDLFWRLFNLLSKTNVPKNILSERLMTRRYVDALVQIKDVHLFLAGIYSFIGYKQIGIETQRKRKGETSYSLNKRINLFIDAITSFSSYPLKVLFYVGSLITLFSIAILFYFAIRKNPIP
ncbi:MAG: hypothetical protein KatS3mg028_1286 [Bacteroidia bacterium]|nr:MAG: hypothetical protein KatS3mg028_1286 [Bacteroidia bacterium]